MSEKQVHAGDLSAQGQVRACVQARMDVQAQASAQGNAPAKLGSGANAGSGANPAPGAASPAAHPATFQLLYESRDGRLCLFQDGQGHLTCVRAARLAH